MDTDDSEKACQLNNLKLDEARILAKLNHRQETLTIFDVFKEEEHLFIVTELCE